MSAPNIGQALAPHPAPSGASGEVEVRNRLIRAGMHEDANSSTALIPYSVAARAVAEALATTGGDALEQAARECQAVWRCAIGDFVGAMDVLKGQWKKSRRKQDREAGARLAGVLNLLWAARDPAPDNYSQAAANGQALIDRVRRALSPARDGAGS